MNQINSSVLALRPYRRGLAFIAFENPLSPIDWGMKEIRGGKWNARCVAAVRSLIERHHPGVLTIPTPTPAERGSRTERLLALIANHAVGESLEIHRYSQSDVRRCFARVGAVTRYEIAQAIASQVHALSHRLPPVRNAWQRVDTRMYLFEAAALAMTYYGSSEASG
jgi:hypothetical protein